jgi:hypothetical protein
LSKCRSAEVPNVVSTSSTTSTFDKINHHFGG